MTVGEKIKSIRLAKNMTQKALGERCGIHEANLRKYEAGRQEPKLDTLLRISAGLDIPLQELLPEEDLLDERKYDPRFTKELEKKVLVIKTLMQLNGSYKDLKETRETIINELNDLRLQQSGEGLEDVQILPEGMDYYTYRQQLLLELCEFLNDTGMERLFAYLIDLTKIPEYTK